MLKPHWRSAVVFAGTVVALTMILRRAWHPMPSPAAWQKLRDATEFVLVETPSERIIELVGPPHAIDDYTDLSGRWETWTYYRRVFQEPWQIKRLDGRFYSILTPE